MSVAILVVEDDRRIRETIVSALEAEHYSVIGVDSSEEAWFLLCEQKFQLIVLDINLPKRDGVEFLKLRNCGTGGLGQGLCGATR
jgi:DNA-binding response OmpR family regulator